MIGQFMLAAQSGDLPEIKRLVGMGIGIDACHARDGKTALMKASESGYHDVVMFLMEKGARVDGNGGRSGKTALIRAAERGHWQVVDALLRAGANPNARSRNRGKTALMGAIGCGNLASALLLIKAGADVHARNWQGETAEDIGAKHGRLDLLELLRNRGADFTGHAGSGDSHSQGEDADEWYEILGCQKTDSCEQIRAKYLDLMKQYHPDMIQAKGLPNPFVKFANERCMLIQDAYQRVMKDRE